MNKIPCEKKYLPDDTTGQYWFSTDCEKTGDYNFIVDLLPEFKGCQCLVIARIRAETESTWDSMGLHWIYLDTGLT